MPWLIADDQDPTDRDEGADKSTLEREESKVEYWLHHPSLTQDQHELVQKFLLCKPAVWRGR